MPCFVLDQYNAEQLEFGLVVILSAPDDHELASASSVELSRGDPPPSPPIFVICNVRRAEKGIVVTSFIYYGG